MPFWRADFSVIEQRILDQMSGRVSSTTIDMCQGKDGVWEKDNEIKTETIHYSEMYVCGWEPAPGDSIKGADADYFIVDDPLVDECGSQPTIEYGPTDSRSVGSAADEIERVRTALDQFKARWPEVVRHSKQHDRRPVRSTDPDAD